MQIDLEKAGLEKSEFFQIAIQAMQEISTEIGLKKAPQLRGF